MLGGESRACTRKTPPGCCANAVPAPDIAITNALTAAAAHSVSVNSTPPFCSSVVPQPLPGVFIARRFYCRAFLLPGVFIAGRFYCRAFLLSGVFIAGRFYCRAFLLPGVFIAGRFYCRAFLLPGVFIAGRFYCRAFLLSGVFIVGRFYLSSQTSSMR
jgi:hypothetical protein